MRGQSEGPSEFERPDLGLHDWNDATAMFGPDLVQKLDIAICKHPSVGPSAAEGILWNVLVALAEVEDDLSEAIKAEFGA